ncbi:MAG TPA: hypothetical protein VIY86_15135, partial [Pirellulaceae bacterium]
LGGAPYAVLGVLRPGDFARWRLWTGLSVVVDRVFQAARDHLGVDDRESFPRYWRNGVAEQPQGPTGMPRRHYYLKLGRATLAILVALCLIATAQACPSCKDSVAAGGGGANLARGFGWSIIFMLSMPILILTGISSYFYLLVRQARA